MSEEKKIEEFSAEEALTEFKKGKKVRVAPSRKKDRMSLYNLRVENETLDGLLELSEKEGKPPSLLAREILKEGIQNKLSVQGQNDWETWNVGFVGQALSVYQRLITCEPRWQSLSGFNQIRYLSPCLASSVESLTTSGSFEKNKG